MKNIFSRHACILFAALLLCGVFLFAACTEPEAKWKATTHKAYYNNQQIKVVAQRETQIAVYDATATSNSLLLGWRAPEDASWSAVAVSFDGVLQTAAYDVEEFIDGNDALYHAVKIRKLTPVTVKIEVTYKQDTVQSYEFQLPDILQAIKTYAAEKKLDLFL